jgi:hypothetical protein
LAFRNTWLITIAMLLCCCWHALYPFYSFGVPWASKLSLDLLKFRCRPRGCANRKIGVHSLNCQWGYRISWRIPCIPTFQTFQLRKQNLQKGIIRHDIW